MTKLEEKVQIIKNKYEGVENDKKELIGKDTSFSWEENYQNSSQEGEQMELTEEEIKKMKEWKEKEKEQDKHLEEIIKIVRGMKDVAISIGDNIKSEEKEIKIIKDKMVKTNVKINSQNERLKELIKKIRPCHKFCCDIILILIFLGLVCVLYSLLKHKYLKK